MCSSEPFITQITALKQWEVTKSWTSPLIPFEQTDQHGMCSWAYTCIPEGERDSNAYNTWFLLWKKRTGLGIETCAVRAQRHLKREFSQKWHFCQCVLTLNDFPKQYDLLSFVEYQKKKFCPCNETQWGPIQFIAWKKIIFCVKQK